MRLHKNGTLPRASLRKRLTIWTRPCNGSSNKPFAPIHFPCIQKPWRAGQQMVQHPIRLYLQYIILKLPIKKDTLIIVININIGTSNEYHNDNSKVTILTERGKLMNVPLFKNYQGFTMIHKKNKINFKLLLLAQSTKYKWSLFLWPCKAVATSANNYYHIWFSSSHSLQRNTAGFSFKGHI